MKTVILLIIATSVIGCQSSPYTRKHGINIDPEVEAKGNKTAVTTIDYIPINIFFNGNVLSHVNQSCSCTSNTIPTNAIPPYYTQDLKTFVELIRTIKSHDTQVFTSMSNDVKQVKSLRHD